MIVLFYNKDLNCRWLNLQRLLTNLNNILDLSMKTHSNPKSNPPKKYSNSSKILTTFKHYSATVLYFLFRFVTTSLESYPELESQKEYRSKRIHLIYFLHFV